MYLGNISFIVKRYFILPKIKEEKMKRLFTSESVTEGHPDKMCDQISDAILDSILEQDPMARVACETATTTGMVLVMGEVTTDCYVDIQKIVRDTVAEIGYTRAKFGFDATTCSVLTSIHEQSPDIAQGVNASLEIREGEHDALLQIGAGDQGMMFGYATNETPEYMPMPINLAQKLARRLAVVRKTGIMDYLRPDGKTQVTVEYDENEKPVRVDTIVVSAQHSSVVTQEEIRRDIIQNVINAVIPEELMDEHTKIYVNPTGKFEVGGPQGDSGLTGRKIIVDTYGGYGRHGGGAFSGKDPTKVDRSAAYAARWVAKNLVAAGVADRLELQLSYAIGVSKPISIEVFTFGTEKISHDKIIDIIMNVFDLRPGAIIRDLDLRKPIYKQTAAYGHFGRNDLDLTWERLDKVEVIKNLMQSN